ncbi:hypothetical protein [Archangium sp. Cb G35]|uniref:hypothetical protein n=1 Tax=Archangium sp. Cb G35 TaxID=1920190 RepID=UPI000A42F41D|nr:hypothetical protein [Archangium sp. Cb G35]
MKKIAPWFRAWASCLMVLGSGMAWAQNTGRVFIQGSEVNLRARPSDKAEVVTKVPIATECQRLADAAKGWVRLKCGEVEGFTLKSLVGADKPSFDKLLAQAQDTKASTQVRYDAATRAATLDPKNDKALELLADLFFESAFEQLDKETMKGGPPEAVFIKREYSRALDRKRSLEESFIWELEKIEYDWHQLRFRRGGFRGSFVSAMFRDGLLFVYSGFISPNAGKGKFGKELDEFGVNIKLRTSSAASETLKLALQKGARPPDTRDDKYSDTKEEYAGMPALSPEAFRLFRSLSPLWYLLQGKKGERHVDQYCGMISGILLRTDIHRRAVMVVGSIYDYGDDPPRVMRVTDVSKNGSSYQLQLLPDGAKQLVALLAWPTEEPNVGRWGGLRMFIDGGDYAVANAKGIQIKDNGCTSNLGQ